jgi:hypothetical protein
MKKPADSRYRVVQGASTCVGDLVVMPSLSFTYIELESTNIRNILYIYGRTLELYYHGGSK